MFGKTEEQKRQSVLKAEYLCVRTEAMNFSEMTIDKKTHSIKHLPTGEGGPIKGAHATVETEGEIRERFTATRMLAVGVFALAFKKKTSDKDVYIVVEHPDYSLSFHVPAKQETKARTWARQFNAVADRYEFPEK